MDIQQLLSTGVIVAVVTCLCNWFFYSKNRSTDLVFDYKKYVLNKRIKAYENVENIFSVDLDTLQELGYLSYKEPNEIEEQHISSKLMAPIVAAQSQHLWLSYKMNGAITNLRDAIKDLPPDRKAPTLGERVNGNVKIIPFLKALKNVQTAYFNDITKLNDVDGFYKHVTNRSTMLQSLDVKFDEMITTAEDTQSMYNANQMERTVLETEFSELENEINDLKKDIALKNDSPELQIKINNLNERAALIKAKLH